MTEICGIAMDIFNILDFKDFLSQIMCPLFLAQEVLFEKFSFLFSWIEWVKVHSPVLDVIFHFPCLLQIQFQK